MQRSFILLFLFACLGMPGTALANKRLCVLSFSGPHGADAARMVSRALAGSGQMVSSAEFAREASAHGGSSSADGLSKAARALRVAAVVKGSISRIGSRWVLKMTVHSGHNGRPVGSATLPLRGARLDALTARRVPASLRAALARAQAGAPMARGSPRGSARASASRTRGEGGRRSRTVETVPVERADTPRPGVYDDGSDVYQAAPSDEAPVAVAPAPVDEDEADEFSGSPPPPRTARAPAARSGDSLGFEVAGTSDGQSAAPQYGTRSSPTETTYSGVEEEADVRPPWESIIEISLGVMAVKRFFDINDPAVTNPNQELPPDDPSWVTSCFHLEGAFYPIAIFHHGPMANLGIVARYYRVFYLRTLNTSASTKKNPEAKGPFDTLLSDLELGLRYRWNILSKASSPTFNVGLEFGRGGFRIDDGPDYVNLPDITYTYLNLALVNLEVPFYVTRTFGIGAMGSFDYLLIFSSGDIENQDSSGYGPSSTGGLEAELGLFASYKGFFLRLNGFYRRIWFDFDSDSCAGCKRAGGALDQYLGGYARLGYAY